MTEHGTERIRNVALVGHHGAGKTTLAEAILHRAGVTNRPGSVDNGSSTLDREPEELAAQELGLARGGVVRLERQRRQPLPRQPARHARAPRLRGRGRRRSHRRRPRRARGQRRRRRRGRARTSPGRSAPSLGLPCLVFVSKEDKSRADYERVVADLRAAFGQGVTPIELPLGEEAAFHGVADVLAEVAHEYDPDGRHHVEPLPDDVVQHEHEVHDQVVEEIVSGDDAQLERYLDGEMPEPRGARAHTRLRGAGPHRVPGARRIGRHGRRRRPPRRLRLRDRPVAGGPPRHGVRRRPDQRGRCERGRRSAARRVQDRLATSTSARSRSSRSCRAPWRTTRCSATSARATTSGLHGLLQLRGGEQVPVPQARCG